MNLKFKNAGLQNVKLLTAEQYKTFLGHDGVFETEFDKIQALSKSAFNVRSDFNDLLSLWYQSYRFFNSLRSRSSVGIGPYQGYHYANNYLG